MTDSLPGPAVVRFSRVTFAPHLYDKVVAMDKKTSEYLVPVIQRLPGFIRWYAGVSERSFVQISLWDSEEHAKQMDHLKEMTIDARSEFAAIGVSFDPEHALIVNYPLTWSI